MHWWLALKYIYKELIAKNNANVIREGYRTANMRILSS